jgi:hypothetical protein
MSRKRFAPKYGGGFRDFYMPTTGHGQTNRRDRRKCMNYKALTDHCIKLGTDCVGPAKCKEYCTSEKKKSGSSLVGEKIYLENRGEGTVISVVGDICTVQFGDVKVQCKKSMVTGNSLKRKPKL